MTIRQLKSGERLPDGEPRRYATGHGYVRCRWSVGPYQEVEVYEHRIDWSVRAVVEAQHVHHRNHDRSDNSPANLLALSAREHGREHQKIDWDAVVALYLAGLTTTQVARKLKCDAGQVSRILARRGITARATRDYAARREEADVRAAYAAARTSVDVGRILGVSKAVARRMMKECGLPPFPCGRPSTAG